MIELSKYTLEALGQDKEFKLYRGRSKDDTSRILILSPAALYPAPETLKRLEREYSPREDLDPAWAARPMALARHLGPHSAGERQSAEPPELVAGTYMAPEQTGQMNRSTDSRSDLYARANTSPGPWPKKEREWQSLSRKHQ